jgi:acyl-CoA reductase-like NAD-dependent aldehyde dehydrogenase
MEPTATTSGTAAAEADQDGAPSAAETFDVHRPTDGSVIRSVAIDSPERVAEVVARVRAAQPAWEALGFEGRYLWLGRLRDWMFDHADSLADVMQAETGKVRADAETEPLFICDAINFWGQRAARYLADETPASHNPMFKVKRLRVTYRP